MPEQQGGDSVPWPTLIALLLAVGSATLYFSPLTSDRPDFSPGNSQSLGYEDVEARLWQDPFQAVKSVYQAPKSWTESTSIDLKMGGTQFHGTLQLDHYQGDVTATTEPSMTTGSGATGTTQSPSRLPGAKQKIPPATQPAQRHSLRQIQEEIQESCDRRSRNGEVTTLILPVMVQADAYAEVAEQRLRARVAVLEALGIRGYKPVDTVHIGYFTLRWPWARMDRLPSAALPADECTEQKTIDLVVPYEWCEAGGMPMAGSQQPVTRYRRVLVLWMNENVFYDFPVTRLGWLLQLVIPKDSTADVRIIGPYVSTTLRAMVEEAGRLPQGENALEGPFDSMGGKGRVRILSPWATASDDALYHGIPPARNPVQRGESVAEYLTRSFRGKCDRSFQFVRTMHDDLDVCKELTAELRRRNIDIPTRTSAASTNEDPTTSPHPIDNIAVIGEWDTIFGRALPLTFAAAASGYSLDELANQTNRFPNWIKPFVYLRGIDGKVSSSSSPGSPTDSSNGSSSSKSTSSDHGNSKISGPAEPPEGTNQSDYLRRLADQLSDWDESLRRDGQRLTAVGVLGTDVYDKLLVLRAVRDRLPAGVVFFTTDLDARYNLPSEWKTTHNLVVASSYGLRLHKYFQGNIPPFRDSLQTGAFAATVAAVDPSQIGTGEWTSLLGRPRVFEIGRTGAFDMSVDAVTGRSEADFGTYSDDKAEPKTNSKEESPVTLQPRRRDLESWWGETQRRLGVLVGMLLSLALLFTFVILLGLRPKAFEPSQLLTYTSAFLLLAITFVCAFLGLLIYHYQLEQEPFALIEGISVWPTEALRLLAGLLCVHFVLKAEHDVKRSNDEVCRKFNLKQPEEAPPFWETLRKGIRRWEVYGNDTSSTRFCTPEETSDPDNAKVYAEDVWHEYCVRACNRMRFARILPAAFLYFVAAAFLVAIFGTPQTPVRGHGVWILDQGITTISAFLAIAFTFHVIDATYLNSRIIHLLLKRDTHWPIGAQKQFQRTQIDPLELTEYLDIRFIAMRTEVVGKVIYFPFVIFFLMIVSRISLFDNWDWPIGLLIVFATNVSLALLAAILLRYSAEDARRVALRKLQERRLACLQQGNEERADAFDLLANEVQQEREGAFSILSQYPWLAAILLPSGGIGLWVILQHLSQSFAGTP